jgi:hypothetical protein
MVQIMYSASQAESTLSGVLKNAVAETMSRYSNEVTSSALALGALNVRVPRGLALSDPASQKALQLKLSDANDPIPDGYVALDEMVSRGMLFIKNPDVELNSVTPFVPPLLLLARFADRVALADIRAAGESMSELLAEIDKRGFSVNALRALALAARRRLELLMVPAHLSLEMPYLNIVAACPFFVDTLTSFCRREKRILMHALKSGVSDKDEIKELLGAHEGSEFLVDGSLKDEVCTLAADARGMVGDASILAMCQGLGSNEGYQQTIHEVNSKSIERWHARYECMMRQLYADADRYLPEGSLPDYSNMLLSRHYNKPGSEIRFLQAAQFNWKLPLEMVMGVTALPDYSDLNSLVEAKGKMLVMRPGFPGFELAWVAHRVDSAGSGRPVLFLEQHKMQLGVSPESVSTLVQNLKNALAEAKAANWDPKDVVYVIKSTRPLPGGSWRGAVNADKSDFISGKRTAGLSEKERMQLADLRETEAIELYKSTTVVLLCGKDGLGRYLGPMLWSSLTAGDALGPAVSLQDADADEEEVEEGEEEEEGEDQATSARKRNREEVDEQENEEGEF